MARHDSASSDAIHLVPPPQFSRLPPPVSEGARTEERTEQPTAQEPKQKIADRLAAWPVEPGAPLFVAGAVLACAALGGATGAVIGYRRRLNPFIIGVDMSITWGLGSLAFFSVREYIVTPALVESRVTRAHWQRADELGVGRGSSGAPTQCVPWPHTHDPATNATVLAPQPPSMGDVRTARLLDSGLAGAAVGAIFATPKILAQPQDISMRATLRRAAIGLRAGFTGALITVLAQAVVNEGRVVRLKMLAYRAGRAADADAEADGDSPQTTAASVPDAAQTPAPALCTKGPVRPTSASRTTPVAVPPPAVPIANSAPPARSPPTPTPSTAPITTSTSSTAPTPTPPTATPEISISDSMSSPLKPQGEGRGDAPLSGKIMGVLARVLPVRRLSDDEYLATLERKRADVDKRLKEIEGEQWAMFERAEEAEREAETGRTG